MSVAPNDITLVTDGSVDISEVTTPRTPVQVRQERETQERINIGQYPTPEHRVMSVDENAYEEGYDSDGQLGPFYDAVEGEGGIMYHEDSIRCAMLDSSTPSLDNAAESSQTGTDTNADTSDTISEESNRLFTMQDGDIKKLYVKDLREQCKLLGLDTRGNKQPLIERLIKAREDKLCYLPPNQVGNPERNQLASDGFSPLARWELLKVEEDAIPLEDELEVGGIKYCAPTVPCEEFERTGVGGGGQKKYNY